MCKYAYRSRARLTPTWEVAIWHQSCGQQSGKLRLPTSGKTSNLTNLAESSIWQACQSQLSGNLDCLVPAQS